MRFAIALTLFAGCIPAALAQSTPHALTLHQAIAKALHNNVHVQLASAQTQAAKGKLTQARAAFLPSLSASVGQSHQKVNLAAQGIDITAFMPGASNLVTYNSFHARLQLRESLINISDWQQYASARAARHAAQAKTSVSREQTAAQTARAYVRALRSQQAVKAAQADLALARQLSQLAHDQHHAGVVSGVDVARAETALSQRKVRLAQARTQADQAHIQLARVTGLPLGQPLVLTSSLAIAHIKPPATQQAIETALHDRPELVLSADRLDAQQHRLSAARSQRLPSLSISGSYGRSGNTPVVHREETYRVMAQVQMPLFAGGAISGRIDTAQSQVAQARLRQRDTRRQIEQDVRLALRTLATSSQRLRAAHDNRNLALRELKLARDRFAAGVTDNIEVTDAQASLANARNALVAALAQYADARVNLAAALGHAQSIHFGNTP